MKNFNALVFSAAIVLFAIIIGNAYTQRGKKRGTISVTGLGTIDFKSDLIVWNASFYEEANTLREAFDKLSQDRNIISNYLKNNGLSDSDFVFESITSEKKYISVYNDDGKYIGENFAGYQLTQNLSVKSTKVETVENISRKITELINQNINLESKSPSYYYTKLADLKLKLIKQATDDAKKRAEIIVTNAGSRLGKLIYSDMGVFQITGLYEDETYTWGGVFNTSSKFKTASVTVHLTYSVR